MLAARVAIQHLDLQEHPDPRGCATPAFSTPPGPAASGIGSGQNLPSKHQSEQQVPAPEEETQAATHPAQAISQVREPSIHNQPTRSQKHHLERGNMMNKLAGMMVTNRSEASASILSHLPVFQEAISIYLHAVSTSYFQVIMFYIRITVTLRFCSSIVLYPFCSQLFGRSYSGLQ
jgi:hypothetical protein